MVNTFILCSDLRESFKLLDNRRLGKQRVEAKQIIDVLLLYDQINNDCTTQEQLIDLAKSNILFENVKGWKNHPATKMWIGHTNALKAYFNLCVKEWISRGKNNTMQLYDINENEFSCYEYIVQSQADSGDLCGAFVEAESKNKFPRFVSFPPLHLSHKASLKMKDAAFYSAFDVGVYANKGYFWPCNHSPEVYNIWKMEYLAPLGSGVPAQFRVSLDIVIAWRTNKLVNPVSRKHITEKGNIYKDFANAEKHYIKLGELI